MVVVPAPVVAGLNVLLVTPEPEYTPPAGEPPLNANGAAFEHTGLNAASVGAPDDPDPMLTLQVVV